MGRRHRHGIVQANRPVIRATGGLRGGAQLMVPVAYLPSDNPSSLVAWFRKGVGVTITGVGVSTWADQSGNGRDLLQGVDAKRPSYDGSAVITFDGTADYLQCADFTLGQPCQISLLVANAWVSGRYMFDASALAGNDSGILYGTGSTPELSLYAGISAAANSGVSGGIGSFHAVSTVFNGASSSFKVDTNAATTGDVGARVPGGFTLGARSNPPSTACGNIAVKEVIIRNVNDATIRANDHAYLLTL